MKNKNLYLSSLIDSPRSIVPRHLFLALLFLMTAFVGCDNTDDTVITPSIPLIKEMTFYRNDTITGNKTFEYDQQGRLILAVTNLTTEKYVYEPGMVMMETYWAQTNKTVNYTLVLNSQGWLDHQEGSSESLEYDAQGYLIQSILGATFKSIVEEGNLVRDETWILSNGTPVLDGVFTRTFFKDKPNTIGMENQGLSFFGKQNRNPVNRDTYYNPKLELETSITWQYEYDAQNRIIKSSRSDIPNTYTKYTYVE